MLGAAERLIAEDFGWCVMLQRKPFTLWIGCANVDDTPNRWRVFVVAESGLLGKLIGSADPNEAVARVESQLRELVPTILGVSNIQWSQ